MCIPPNHIWLKKNRHTVFPCETQNVVFVLLVIIVSPFHQHIPCDIVVVFGYLRLIFKGPFEDDVHLPKVGYVSSLQGKHDRS